MEKYTPRIWQKIKSLWGGNKSVVSNVSQETQVESNSFEEEKAKNDSYQEKFYLNQSLKVEHILEIITGLVDRKQHTESESEDSMRSQCFEELHESKLESCRIILMDLQNSVHKLITSDDYEKERLIMLYEERGETIRILAEMYQDLCDFFRNFVKKIADLEEDNDVKEKKEMKTIGKLLNRTRTSRQEPPQSHIIVDKIPTYMVDVRSHTKPHVIAKDTTLRTCHRIFEEKKSDIEIEQLLRNRLYASSSNTSRRRSRTTTVLRPLYSKRKNIRRDTKIIETKYSSTKRTKNRGYPKLLPLAQGINQRDYVSNVSSATLRNNWIDSAEEVCPEESVSQVIKKEFKIPQIPSKMNQTFGKGQQHYNKPKSKCDSSIFRLCRDAVPTMSMSETSTPVAVNELFRRYNIDVSKIM